MNRRLNLDIPQNNTFLLQQDILAAAHHLIGLQVGMGTRPSRLIPRLKGRKEQAGGQLPKWKKTKKGIKSYQQATSIISFNFSLKDDSLVQSPSTGLVLLPFETDTFKALSEAALLLFEGKLQKRFIRGLSYLQSEFENWARKEKPPATEGAVSKCILGVKVEMKCGLGPKG
ncbi:DNA-directed RNA polymerase subunit beta [Striga asiatica]|uniref:DNA-directed RNA polymerase subunit beta n=1 Tax=Striga asiatica TaxID=4170 RepID=A0A5A7P5M9_STRAF|nr:DNA-directed RNA polymerase subunit beta [Striga asiatica]